MGHIYKILVLTDFSSGYSRSLLRGIVRYSQMVGGWSFFRMPMHSKMMYGDEEVIKWAKKWKADAIIAQIDDLDIKQLRRLGIPIIVQNYRDRIPGVCNLTGDYVGTGHMAADYFLRQGHTNFAYYGTDASVWSRERFAGFAQKLAEKNLSTPPYCFLEKSNIRESPVSNFEQIGQWLKDLPKPVALFACDDLYALHISETCKMFDIAVPDDIAILGVDNDELTCSISNPPLSSIFIDSEEGGFIAGQVLHEFIKKKELVEPFDISISPRQVIQRESTLRYVIGDKYVMKAVEFIEKNYMNRISVSDIMEFIPISRRVFEKRFRQNTGDSIYRFIVRYRIEQFAAKLVTSNRSIEDLAISCGFDGYKNVSRAFLRYKKMTPSQFRRHNNDEVTGTLED